MVSKFMIRNDKTRSESVFSRWITEYGKRPKNRHRNTPLRPMAGIITLQIGYGRS